MTWWHKRNKTVSGEFVWACKNYDGDVQSDTIAQGLWVPRFNDYQFLLTPDGKTNGIRSCSWNRHKTLQALHQDGKRNINKSYCIYFCMDTWFRLIVHRLDNNEEIDKIHFCNILESVCIKTVEDGFMTKDLSYY